MIAPDVEDSNLFVTRNGKIMAKVAYTRGIEGLDHEHDRDREDLQRMIRAVRDTNTPESPSSSSNDSDHQGNEADGEDSDIRREIFTSQEVTPESSPPAYQVIDTSPDRQPTSAGASPAMAPGADNHEPTPGTSRGHRSGKTYTRQAPTPGRPGKRRGRPKK